MAKPEDDDLPDFGAMSAYQLIEHLDVAFPHTCIAKGQSLEDAHRYAGQRELIDLLVLAKHDEQSGKKD